MHDERTGRMPLELAKTFQYAGEFYGYLFMRLNRGKLLMEALNGTLFQYTWIVDTEKHRFHTHYSINRKMIEHEQDLESFADRIVRDWQHKFDTEVNFLSQLK